MKNIIKISICLLVVTVSSLNAATSAAPLKPKIQPAAAMAMAITPSTYGQDQNAYY